MKIYQRGFFALILLCFSPYVLADDPISDALKILNEIQTYQSKIAGFQQDIDSMTKNIQSSLNGLTNDPQDNKGFDFAQWGNDAQAWQSALGVAGSGGSNSPLGQEISSIHNDFPIDTTTFNQSDPSAIDQKYYKEQSETVLAARAASQLDYNKLQSQIDYQKQLKDQVYKTQTLKQSVDLQNQLQVEHNLIDLELLRQVSLLNQQQALQSQAYVNSDIKNAQFSK